MSYRPLLSGRQARRQTQFGEGARRKGAGWTRAFRKGRTQRLPYTTATPQDATPVEKETS